MTRTEVQVLIDAIQTGAPNTALEIRTILNTLADGSFQTGDIKEIEDKNILLRVDFDVPLNKDMSIANNTRIKECLPTINYLISKNAKIALLTKMGNPQESEKISTQILISEIEKLTNKKVRFIDDCIGNKVAEAFKNLKINEIILLENVRFYKEEIEQNMEFAKNLAKGYDLYVNESFAMCHRKDTSITLIPQLLLSYAGFRLTKENNELRKVLKSTQKPFIAIIGGAKVESKMPVISNLSKIATKILVGGKIPFEQGAEELKKLKNVLLPIDDWDKKDIGSKTIELYKKEIEKAKIVIWSGPLGMFETLPYNKGTNEIALEIINNKSA